MNRLLYLVCSGTFLAGLGIGVTANREPASAMSISPADGWTIHVDAKKHFGDANPDEIAHHWCKKVDGFLECQIYDADGANAHLVAVETIVDPATYRSFDRNERAQWHYHKDEIPKVDIQTPDLSSADSQKLIADLNETYGKVRVLWDPAAHALPVGKPSVSVLK